MHIAILTNFTGKQDPCSIVQVVRNQVEVLSRYEHNISVFVSEEITTDHFARILPYRHSEKSRYLETEILPVIPSFEPTRYINVDHLSDEHKAVAVETAMVLAKQLQGFDVVFTHDWINSSLHLPLAEGLRILASQTHHLPFLHWIHSVPCQPMNWWTIHRYGIPNHKIVYPVPEERTYVADAFCTEIQDIRVIPHINDLRNIFEMSEETRNIIDKRPGMLDATFTQIYPAARDRLTDKGLKHLIYIYKELKKRKFSVCIGIIDSWTGKRNSEDLEHYHRMAERNSLTRQEIWFLSDLALYKDFSDVSHTIVRELMQFTNLFVYPTMGEAYGLVLSEAILAGGVLPVINRSIPMMMSRTGRAGLYFDFGSVEKQVELKKDDYEWMANQIIAAAQYDDCFRARTHLRRTENMDAIYNQYYGPILAESQLWVRKAA